MGWRCFVCTYVHDEREAHFLVCATCGAQKCGRDVAERHGIVNELIGNYAPPSVPAAAPDLVVIIDDDDEPAPGMMAIDGPAAPPAPSSLPASVSASLRKQSCTKMAMAFHRPW